MNQIPTAEFRHALAAYVKAIRNHAIAETNIKAAERERMLAADALEEHEAHMHQLMYGETSHEQP